MNTDVKAPFLTLAIPLLNEEGSLDELYRQIITVVDANHWTCEILFIDDGSNDGSFEKLRALAERDARVRLIAHRRNYGKSAGLATAFRAATGKYVIMLDADLQDNPDEFPALVRKLEEGYDMISGWKKVRHDPITKTLPSKIYNHVTGRVFGIRLHDFNCGLKIMRNQVAKDLEVYGELHRFLPVMAHKMGYRVTEIPVLHRPRIHGKSKFGAKRLLTGFLDILTVAFLTGYRRAPSHLFGTVGLITLLIGFIINLYLSVGWFAGIPIGNRPLLFLGILLMVVGVQFFSFGLVAEMLVNTTERDRAYAIRFDSAGETRSEGVVSE